MTIPKCFLWVSCLRILWEPYKRYKVLGYSRTSGTGAQDSGFIIWDFQSWNLNISAINPGLVHPSPPPPAMNQTWMLYHPALRPFPLLVLLGTYTCCYGNVRSAHSWNWSIRVPGWAAQATLSSLDQRLNFPFRAWHPRWMGLKFNPWMKGIQCPYS